MGNERVDWRLNFVSPQVGKFRVHIHSTYTAHTQHIHIHSTYTYTAHTHTQHINIHSTYTYTTHTHTHSFAQHICMQIYIHKHSTCTSHTQHGVRIRLQMEKQSFNLTVYMYTYKRTLLAWKMHDFALLVELWITHELPSPCMLVLQLSSSACGI